MKIEIKHIRKNYGKQTVLKDVSFTVEGGKCVGILGGNGCGKSTLLSILAGIQSADGGAFLYEDKDLFTYPRQRAQLVGYVPQGTPLIEELTAKDNLSLWCSKEKMERELKGGVFKLLGLDEFLKVPVSKMSGGMKKRLSIGCSIAHDPPILLLDEVTSALDAQTEKMVLERICALDISCKQKIFDYIGAHKRRGGIVLLVTHDVMELQLCDEGYILKDGTVHPFTYTGDTAELVRSF